MTLLLYSDKVAYDKHSQIQQGYSLNHSYSTSTTKYSNQKD